MNKKRWCIALITICILISVIKIIYVIALIPKSLQQSLNTNIKTNFFNDEWNLLYESRHGYDDCVRLYVFSVDESNVNTNIMQGSEDSSFVDRWNYFVTTIKKDQIIDDNYLPSFNNEYKWTWYIGDKNCSNLDEENRTQFLLNTLAIYSINENRIYTIVSLT